MNLKNIQMNTEIAFILLFAAELIYYLLILQTGIITNHHSNLIEIWMLPVGGITGILCSIFVNRDKQAVLFPFLMTFQMMLLLDYGHITGTELFLLGIISGFTAPLLIYRIHTLFEACIILAFSYTAGTALFHIEAENRTLIALILTGVALLASLGTDFTKKKNISSHPIPIQSMAMIFCWLFLDATLFEMLSRNPAISIWGKEEFTFTIIVSHLIGIIVAYILRKKEYNHLLILLLFILSYSFYIVGNQLLLSLFYPFVISYYNIQILDSLRKLNYKYVAIISLSLWGASGLGLITALSHTIWLPWIAVIMLALFRNGKHYPTLRTITFQSKDKI
jgi:hypothetical protein